MNLPPKLAESKLAVRWKYLEKKHTHSLDNSALYFTCIVFLRVFIKIQLATLIIFIFVCSYLGVSRLTFYSLLVISFTKRFNVPKL
jgi:hypothetical protein